MNNYYITTKDFSLGYYPKTHYWNRRKQRFQSYLTIACIYPTVTGCKRIFREISIDNPNVEFCMKRLSNES